MSFTQEYAWSLDRSEFGADPDQQLADLPLMTETERRQLLVEWNDTTTQYPREACIHKLFEAQVERTPDAVAVVCSSTDDSTDRGKLSGQNENLHLSYQALNRRANQLAHHLRGLGVEPGVLVSICVERSPEMVVGLLGILKAGGVYVPLDPTYPQERLAFIVEDAGISVLLTRKQYLENLPKHTAHVVCLDADWEVISRGSDTDPIDWVMADNPAYVIYTSGSTGKPKGILVLHRALVNHGVAVAKRYDLRPDDRVLQFASISFDVAAEELYPSWLSGATVVFRRDEALTSLGDFLGFVREEKLTVLNLPAPYWHELVSYLARSGAELPSTLCSVIVGSEKVLPDRLATWQELVGERVRWWNAYGPTEATITTTIYEPRAHHKSVYSVPIGRPIANTQIYLLDEHLQPVPIGVPGELFIGGDCLAQGYLNRPDLTAERFIPNPFPISVPPAREREEKEGNLPRAASLAEKRWGTRLYRTGDLAHYLPDGDIEFLGRIDHQVKLRGFRVELGEIEAVLAQHSAVQETVVLARQDTPSNTRLVAYVVPDREKSPALDELRQALKDRLPDYMVPSIFVLLDSLPLTPSGKVDRRALPVPDYSAFERDEAFVAPRTPIEEVLAGIWSQLLGIERVGVHDNFFELGGHSLLATQLIARVRETFHVELPLFSIFRDLTIANLAAIIEQGGQMEQSPELPSIEIAPRDGPLPLSSPQEAIWFVNQLAPGNLAYNAQLAIYFKGKLDVAALEQTFTELVRRHEILRTSFPAIEGKPVQIIHPPRPMTISLADVQTVPEEQREAKVEQLISDECRRPFDITQIPLMRWTLLRLGREEHILVIVEYHFVHDGWSLALLLREMKAIYEAFSEGKPSPLPDPTIQFADFAVWQRRLMQGEFLNDQLAYWKEKLAAPSLLELPTDRPHPRTHNFRGKTQAVVLPPDLYRSLRELSHQKGVTLFMVMLAAFKTLLYRYTGQEDLFVGSSVANRRLRETEALIGMMVNVVVLRTDLSGNPAFRELLGQVRDVALDAYAHQDVPFGKLVEVLQPQRDLSRNALFQVAFDFHDAPVPDLEFPQLRGTIRYLQNNSAKLDLGIVVIPRGEQCVGMGSGVGDEGTLMEWEYNTDLFDAATIERMAGHFQVLLESIVKDPDQRLSDLPVLTKAERRQLLVEWNDTKIEYPRNLCIHELFETQVGQTPHAVAAVFEDQHLTYGELNRRANQLAHYLQELGVGPDVTVGLCAERSVEMVVGLLGILKAGGVYVPLDPAYPKERLASMVRDAQVSVLLTQQQLPLGLFELGVQVVCLDGDWETIGRESVENPVNRAMVDDLAYVIYTSGSTGTPKGVMITHRAVCNRVYWGQAVYPMAETDSVLQMTSIGFDVSVWEFFKPLLAGARLILARPGGHRDSAYLVRLISSHHITVVGFVPSMLQVFLEEERIESCNCLKYVFSGGEALPAKVQRRFLTRLDAQLLNFYGPTETCIDATYWSCERESSQRIVPIGHPIGNAQTHVLDQHLQAVPIGVPGELHIGGVGLARGYLNRPELTAEKFIPHPFSDDPGARLYKTGDLVCYLSDGSIEFLGRVDRQVKVRGFRIELGEIEAALRKHPTVEEVVVIADEQRPSSRQGEQAPVEVEGTEAATALILWHGQRSVEEILTEIEKMSDEQVGVTARS